MALMEVMEETVVDQKQYSSFVDLKAFDTIGTIQIEKLNKFGTRGLVPQWVSSYLKNR